MKEKLMRCRHCGHQLVEVEGVWHHFKFIVGMTTTLSVSLVCTALYPPSHGKACGCATAEPMTEEEMRKLLEKKSSPLRAKQRTKN